MRVHRLVWIVAIALIASACGDVTVTPGIVTQPTGRPSPAPTASPSAIAAEPTETPCPETLDPTAGTAASLKFDGLRSQETVGLYVDAKGPKSNARYVAPVGIQAGGRALSIRLATRRDPATLTALRVTVLRTGKAPIPVDATVSGRRAIVTLPDRTTTASLAFEASWITGCVTHTGTATAQGDLVKSKTVAACQGTETKVRKIIKAHWGDQITTPGAAVTLGIRSFAARYGGYEAWDEVPGFAGYEPAGPRTAVASSGQLVLADDDPDLRITGARVTFYKIADARVGSAAEPIASRVMKPVGDGRWTARVPKRAQAYATEVATTWLLPCVEGTGVTYLTVDVH